MIESDTGGPAFPQNLIVNQLGTVQHPGSHFTDVEGITMLDYFAAKAMNGLCCNEDFESVIVNVTTDPVMEIAKLSYDLGAAMLAEKRKRDGGKS